MKRYLGYVTAAVVVPLVVLLGAVCFGGEQYALLSLLVAVLACVPFFLHFEKGHVPVKKIVVIGVMVALTVASRVLFVSLSGVKPITAMVIFTAMYFGKEAGFMTGAVTAVISNFVFGQGPWTPFQMLVWGLIGFIAGIFAEQLKQYLVLLLIYGIAAGVLFSLVMDVWTVLWIDGGFNASRYFALLLQGLPTTVLYIISNTAFILLLYKPMKQKLERISIKYGI